MTEQVFQQSLFLYLIKNKFSIWRTKFPENFFPENKLCNENKNSIENTFSSIFLKTNLTMLLVESYIAPIRVFHLRLGKHVHTQQKQNCTRKLLEKIKNIDVPSEVFSCSVIMIIVHLNLHYSSLIFRNLTSECVKSNLGPFAKEKYRHCITRVILLDMEETLVESNAQPMNILPLFFH